MASYVTMSLQDKISLLTQLEARQALGPVSRTEGGGRVITEFDTRNVLAEREIAKLIQSILDDADFTSDNPLWDKLQQFRRPGTTKSCFI